LIGLAAGGLAGGVQFERIGSGEDMCLSCHHAATAADELDDPPHSSTYAASCHLCHVLPVREYLSYTAGVFTGTSPGWVEGLTNPVIAEQSCMECHLSTGRGDTDCAACHADGTTNVDVTERCEACHHDRGMVAPFEGMHCRNCHVEAFEDREARVAAIMRARLEGGHNAQAEPNP